MKSALVLAVVLTASSASAAARRIVIIKSDGLPGYLVDEYANRKNQETGRWELPWIRKVFLEDGAEVANFYTHGITVSAPSWCVLETGRESIIRGNVEFDRYSLHAYDYLNFFPFYFRNARSQEVDMPGVEVLDGVGVPLISDAFPEKERFQGFQLYQRGVNWTTLRKSLDRSLNPHSVRNLVDEWVVGLQVSDSVNQETEAELIQKLEDPSIRYLDLFHAEFDHVAHLTHDRRILLSALRNLDTLVGRIWAAIESSGLADETVLVVISDHGMNNDPAIFGQGWNLVDALRSAGRRRPSRHHQSSPPVGIQDQRVESIRE